MTPELPTLSEPVEIDGVSFQTMISSSILTKPEKVLDSTTSFQLGMKITNNSYQDYYFFCMSQNLIFEQRTNSPYLGSIVRTDTYYGDSRYFFFPRNNDLILAKSGEAIKVVFNGTISWQRPYKRTKNRKKRKYKIPIEEEYSVGEEDNYRLAVYLNFKHVSFPLYPFSDEPLSYKIGCEYRMLEVVKYSKDTYHNTYFAHIIPSVLDEIWIGLVHTPFIEFHVV